MYVGINVMILELKLWKKWSFSSCNPPCTDGTSLLFDLYLAQFPGTFSNNINICLKWQARICKVYLSLFNAAVSTTGYCTNYKAEVVIFH